MAYGNSQADESFLDLARKRFQQGQDAQKEQISRELDDLKFYNDDQWPQDVRDSRAGQTPDNGLPAVPARPCLTINKVKEPVRQVLNQERQSDMGVEIVPADDFADLTDPIDPAEIELREGLVRRIQRESHAADARTWAFARAAIAGRGYYGVMTKFAEGKTWDQDIYIQRFYNQGAVTLDPSHEQPDGSDADWAFVGTWMPWEQYKAEFPSSKEKPNRVTDAQDDEFRTLAEQHADWFTTEGDVRMCRVVDYYHTERETRELALMPDGTVAWADELPEGVKAQDTRQVIEKSIKWAKIDGCQVLDTTDWPGRYIPIIKVVGEEIQPYDRERRFVGMVRPARDAQGAFNVMVSTWVEKIGLAPIPPLQVDPEAIEGYESWYKQLNTRTLPYVPFRTYDDQGRPFMPPARPPAESPIAAIAGSVQLFDEAIKSTTGVPDPTLGNVDPTLKSGKAIRLVQQQAALGTSNYLDNMARSVRYEGIIVNDLLYPIYGTRPGRLARIIDGEGEAQTVLIGVPMVQQDGKPVQAPPDAQNPKKYILTKDAAFNVAIKVTQNRDTRAEQMQMMLGDLIGQNPMLMGVIGDLFFKSIQGPGTKEMAERIRATLDPRVLAMLDAKKQGQEADPQMLALVAQNKQLTDALQQTTQELQTQSFKVKADLQKADMDNRTKLEIARMDNETKKQLEVLKANASTVEREDEQRHEVGIEAMKLDAKRQSEEHAATMALATQADEQPDTRGSA